MRERVHSDAAMAAGASLEPTSCSGMPERLDSAVAAESDAAAQGESRRGLVLRMDNLAGK